VPRPTPVSVTDALAEQLGPEQSKRLGDAVAALDLLAELFLPDDDEE
jgi:hypothetical protein